MTEPTRSKEMEAFLEKAAQVEGLAVDGFCRAFVESTGILPEEARMVVFTEQKFDQEGHTVVTQYIWFQRHPKPKTSFYKPGKGGCVKDCMPDDARVLGHDYPCGGALSPVCSKQGPVVKVQHEDGQERIMHLTYSLPKEG